MLHEFAPTRFAQPHRDKSALFSAHIWHGCLSFVGSRCKRRRAAAAAIRERDSTFFPGAMGLARGRSGGGGRQFCRKFNRRKNGERATKEMREREREGGEDGGGGGCVFVAGHYMGWKGKGRESGEER